MVTHSCSSKSATNGHNAPSPKMRSPKELSPGIPRRPTAPREPSADEPDVDVPRHGTSTPRSTVVRREARGRQNTASHVPPQRQQDHIQQQQRSATKRSRVKSEHFARSQLQVNFVSNYCLLLNHPVWSVDVVMSIYVSCDSYYHKPGFSCAINSATRSWCWLYWGLRVCSCPWDGHSKHWSFHLSALCLLGLRVCSCRWDGHSKHWSFHLSAPCLLGLRVATVNIGPSISLPCVC